MGQRYLKSLRSIWTRSWQFCSAC